MRSPGCGSPSASSTCFSRRTSKRACSASLAGGSASSGGGETCNATTAGAETGTWTGASASAPSYTSSMLKTQSSQSTHRASRGEGNEFVGRGRGAGGLTWVVFSGGRLACDAASTTGEEWERRNRRSVLGTLSTFVSSLILRNERTSLGVGGGLRLRGVGVCGGAGRAEWRGGRGGAWGGGRRASDGMSKG